MQKPLELSFRHGQKSDAVVELVNEKVAKLEHVCDYITSCKVLIEKPQTHQQSGNPYRVVIEVRVPPGHDLVARREPGESAMHDDVGTVIRDAFDAMLRQLKEVVARQREQVKSHPDQEAVAVVDEIDETEGHGFLRTVDGRRIYFHRNAVLNDEFDRIRIGTGVRFFEEKGDMGPQASTVQIVDKPGARASE